MNKEFFTNNRKRLFEKIDDCSMAILLSGSAPSASYGEYEYKTNKNFFYFTGLERENFALILLKNGNKSKEMLFIERPDPFMEKWLGPRLKKEEVQKTSGIEQVYYNDQIKNMLNRIVSENKYDTVYLNLQRMNWNSDEDESQKLSKQLLNKYPYLNIKNIYPHIAQLRMIKAKEEVDCLKEAINITKEGIYNMMKNVVPGMKEYQLEAYFDFSAKTMGSKDYSFKTILASGKNATVIHYDSNRDTINENELVLVDLGMRYNNYCADISRTFPASGRFTERQREIYNIVLKAADETTNCIKAGVKYEDIEKKAKDVLTEECKKIGLITKDEEIRKYYCHSVSHHLGLDDHDVGEYDIELKPGMVITVEPGLYIEEEGIGIRIEDDILVTEDGFINLSKDIIKTCDEIEKFMK
jgi:Xaa-Pro aminopeptidase